MAYESPGQGLARGILAGTEMGLRVRRESLLEDQVKRRNEREDEELAWKRSDRERKLRLDEEDRAYTEGERFLKSVEDEYKQTQAAMQAATQQYGSPDKVPPEIASRLTQQWNDVNQRKHAARQKLYGPIIEKEKRKARDIFYGLSNGTTDLSKVSDAEFAMAILAGTEFDPRLFLRGQDGKSQIGRGIELVEQGLGSQDHEATVEGANILYGPSLQVGVGGDGPQGTQIVSKRIVRMVPSPDGKGFIPAMSIQVRDPWGRQLEKDTYIAPPTAERDTNPQGRVLTLDPKTEMDRVGRLKIVESLLNTPEGRAKIERGMQQLGPKADTFREALTMSATPPGKFTTHDTNLGGQVLQTTRNEAGVITGERTLQRTVSPDTTERTRAAGIRTGAAAARPDLRVEEVPEEDPETGEVRTVTRYVRIPKSGGPAEPVVDKEGKSVRAPSKATTNKPPSENEIKGAEERAKRETARREGVRWDENARAWMNIRTNRPATPEQIERIEAAAAEAGRAAAAKKPGGAAPAAEKKGADVEALRAKAAAAIKAGKDPEAVKAKFKELTGQTY